MQLFPGKLPGRMDDTLLGIQFALPVKLKMTWSLWNQRSVAFTSFDWTIGKTFMWPLQPTQCLCRPLYRAGLRFVLPSIHFPLEAVGPYSLYRRGSFIDQYETGHGLSWVPFCCSMAPVLHERARFLHGFPKGTGEWFHKMLKWSGSDNRVTNILQQSSVFCSALCYCTAELLSSRGRPSSVRPSVKPLFLTTHHAV